MFGIGPAFYGGGIFDEGALTPGTPTPSAIPVSGTPVVCKIDGTRALVLYQRTSTFDLAAVVVSVSGGTPSFGTPAVISASSPRIPLSVRPLGDGTQFVAFYRSTTVLYAQVFEVSGTTITTPNSEAASAALTSPGRGYGEVLSSTSAGIVFEASDGGTTKVHGVAITIAAGACTFGTPDISDMVSMGGGGGRPLIRSGELVQFGRLAGAPSYLCAVGFDISGTTCTADTVDVPADVADRIELSSTYGSGATIDAGGGVVALLYQDAGTGSVASVRGAWSGSAATYSNADNDKNILPGSPHAPPPAVEIQGYGQVSPSGSYGTFFTTASGAVKLYPIGIFGTVDMAGDGVTLVASGASALRPGHVYMSATEILYIYVQTSGAVIGAGTCGVG